MNRHVFVMCLVDPVKHCAYLVGEEGSGCFACLWFVAFVLSVLVCFRFLLVSLVGYFL